MLRFEFSTVRANDEKDTESYEFTRLSVFSSTLQKRLPPNDDRLLTDWKTEQIERMKNERYDDSKDSFYDKNLYVKKETPLWKGSEHASVFACVHRF